MNKDVAIIGSGNAFFKDEGVGLYAVKYLKENYEFTPEIEFVDGGTLGFLLMPLLQEYKEVVIVNTASEEGKEAGKITVKSCNEFLEGTLVKKTANEVEIAEMLQICSMAEYMADTVLVSIVPEDIISVEVGLTTALRDIWQDYINTVLEVLQQSGVKAKRREDKISLDDILHTFAYPSIEHGRGF
ncbi:hydrogenase maturation protease [Sulfurimonas sp. HSL-1716]|uniref:hydrogenase maturation protease n=1 Tax=Hydrocurvibacter sulfurireducens TaxID=3131937 RepID=UPI0031F9EBCF